MPDGSHGHRVYTFSIDGRSSLPILHIPGEMRGPDLCTPNAPEQERWLNSLPHLLSHTWDCQWTFVDRTAVAEFLHLLKQVEIKEARAVRE